MLPEWIALGVGAGALTVVHLAQSGGLVPCALCLVERWPYRAALLLGLLGLAWPGSRRAVPWVLVAVFLAGLGIALVHVGVEFGWWASPLPECAAPVLHRGSIAEMLAAIPAHISKPCDDPTYLVPGLKLSMAQMNALLALASAAAIATCMAWKRR